VESLHDLCRLLADLPETTHIRRRIGRPARLRVAPLPGAARLPMLAAVAAGQPVAPCLLYVTGSSDAALRAAEDLRRWLAPEQVLFYPANDAMPYEHMSAGPEALRARLNTLQRLDSPDPGTPLLIVTSVKALLQPTLSPAELADAAIELRIGAEQPPEALLRHWIAQGYQVAPSVELPGELNRRGGIVDIWPPADEQPLRIEWFDVEVDSLRRFDPRSQRSEQRLDTAHVGPPHETPLWNRELAIERLQAIATDSLRAEARKEWEAGLEQLANGERFEGRAFYAPFFRPEPQSAQGTLLAHLPPGAAVLFSEQHLLAQLAGDFHQQAEQQRHGLVDVGELPPDFPRPYLRWQELFAAESAARRLTLFDLSNNIDLGIDPNPDWPVDDTLPAPEFTPLNHYGGQFRRLISEIAGRLERGEQVVAVTTQAARMLELVAETAADAHGRTQVPPGFSAIHGALDEGWHLAAQRISLYTDTEIFGWRQRRPLAERRKRRERSAEERAAFLRGLKSGDYVVHIEHGIAVYEGLLRRSVGGIEREYLSLRYAGGDRIYVPVDQADRVARYIGAGDNAPQLTRLGTQEWERAKRKARAAVQDLAQDLLDLYARRRLSHGHSFAADNEWQRELEAAFPYIETEDQVRALHEVKHDMELQQPMDRLICGDVGFGKTEVALRAAFKAVQDGRQVAILVPTTVLAQQHLDTFRRRMAAFPVHVEMLSRFRSAREQTEIIKRLLRGQIDILIGTHRLLSKDVIFRNLGLVIVDEEQRFGVRHKERLKQLRAEVDVLTLTATPIPRTLHMSLAGIRDLSVIDTPPEDRVPIKTYVVPHNDNLIRDAIRREIERGGQVYFVHNRVQSIYHVANHIRTLVPEAEIGVSHGQLEERQLEKVMLEFFTGAYDVLVCTTIIESGLDVPNANTIIIDDATNYGLAQLHQLRGRVGRSANRAYAYLLYKSDRRITEEAQQRLQAIQEASELGAGFQVAMRDLEIRGAGNLLGAEQSGHIAAVGFDLYSRLLEQAVQQLKERFQQQQSNGQMPQPPSTDDTEQPERRRTRVQVNEKVLVSPLVTLDLPLDAYLPTEYIPNETVRLGVYQRLVEAITPEEVRRLRQELRDRFGEPPPPAAQLLTWLQIKALALKAGVSAVISSNEEFTIRLPILDAVQRDRLERRFQRDKNIKIGPQFARLNRRALGSGWVEKLTAILTLLGDLVELAPGAEVPGAGQDAD